MKLLKCYFCGIFSYDVVLTHNNPFLCHDDNWVYTCHNCKEKNDKYLEDQWEKCTKNHDIIDN